jgi:carbon-monoxide dehydrogenase medium subunit
VKPPPFELVAAGTVEEALGALSSADGEAKVLAGGQSLVPLLNMRLARPAVLVDVNRVTGLDQVAVDGVVRLGALVRQADALDSGELRSAVPLIATALEHVAHPAIRSRGTIGGSLAHADPSAELPAVVTALDGELVAVGPDGERSIPARDFFTGPFTTSLGHDELLTEVVIPGQGQRAYGFAELSRRRGDFALAGAVVLLDPARVVLFGVDGAPVRAMEAESALDGGADAGEAAELATRDLEPVGDVHGDSGYRRRAAAVLVRRSIEQTRGASA